MYSQNDYRDYLEHSWGKKPEQKAAEKSYNAKYYQEHKEKWKKYKENISDALGGKEKKEAKGAEADYVHKGNEYDRMTALDGRYLDDNSYEAKVKAHKDFEKSAFEYEQALLRYRKTPMGRAEQAIATAKTIFKNGKYESWADKKLKSTSRDAVTEHEKRNILWKGDHRYSDWHDDDGNALKKPRNR